MIHKDLKIGLGLGLIIVAGVIIKLAIDPRLSTEARMMQRNDTNNDIENNDLNNIFNQVPVSNNPDNQYEQPEVYKVEDTYIEVAKQNNNEDNYSALQQYPYERAPVPVPAQVELPPVANNNNAFVNETPKRYHVVEEGQSLSKISSIYYGTPNQWQKIVDANPDVIKDPNKIRKGMKLVIP